MVKYRVYPSLLDEFGRFLAGKVTKENLLKRINRIRDFNEETFQRMQRGIRFEKAVLKDIRHDFKPQIINEVKSMLPKDFSSQFSISFIYEDIQVYGFADVVGERRIIDLKTTANFRPEKYQNGFQNLYLYALKDYGAETMEYIVYDFEKIHHLVYKIEEIDFQPYFDNMLAFREFLNENRDEITDQKILVKPIEGLLF
jgi:hypothetical protein